MDEDEKTKLTVEIPKSLWRRSRIRAAEMDTDLRSTVILALEKLLAEPAPSTGMSFRQFSEEEAGRVAARSRARKSKKGGRA